jgi:isoquinoline 1-oxidoreductase beta subunit
LDAAARHAGWGSPPPAGRARGIALSSFVGTRVAEVAEVSVDADGEVRVHRLVVAIDCGTVINPDTVEAQTQSNIVYGLSAALHGEISIERGRVVQSNFHDYPVLRLADIPEVEFHLLRTENPPGGVGEAALPAVAPAVCNAIYAATGKRIRKLPVGRVS